MVVTVSACLQLLQHDNAQLAAATLMVLSRVLRHVPGDETPAIVSVRAAAALQRPGVCSAVAAQEPRTLPPAGSGSHAAAATSAGSDDVAEPTSA